MTSICFADAAGVLRRRGPGLHHRGPGEGIDREADCLRLQGNVQVRYYTLFQCFLKE